MTAATTRWILLISLGFLAVTLLWVRHRQNRQASIGGAIAPAKLLWLGYALYTWFILAPTLAFDPAVAQPLRIVLGAFGVAMWARGPIELFMMYVTKNWRPPYGIAHDAFCLVVLLGVGAWQVPGLAATGLDAWVLAFTAVLAVSLVIEIYYAAAFLRIVGRRTLGEDAIWFASQEDLAFRRIVRHTALFNVPLYGFLVAFLARVVTP